MKKVTLDGEWFLRDSEGDFNLKAKVPGDVYSSLVQAGLMPHPYVGRNEKIFRMLERKSWIFEKTFEIEDISFPVVELVFEGIDTFAAVYLNGELVGNSENMFLEYRFNVKGLLKEGENHILVEIKPSIDIARRLEQNFGKLHAAYESARAYIRKAQYSFGWDWGPRLPSAGIWKSVYLELREGGRLFGGAAYILEKDGPVHVHGYVFSRKDPKGLRVQVSVSGKNIATFPVKAAPSKKMYFEGTLEKHLQLWQPAELGKPVLHDFTFTLLDGEKPIYEEKKKIGLRTVRIIRENDGEGESFIFEINGQKIFAKGANWIPADALLGWATEDEYKKLIKMAKDANMNMLRVWGGGIYEKDIFYELCDELGIMVWQDFMLSCAEYPDHLEWFRKLANKEVWQNVVRLRHHPSIVLWCGNNENLWGFEEWGYDNKFEGLHLGARLYFFDFPKICAQEDPSTPYIPSSPHGGPKANSKTAGDVHIWNVWSGWQDFRQYEKSQGKFVSEFGFQSAPHIKTVEFFTRERNIFSPEILHHNKQIEGMERLYKYLVSEIGILTELEDIIYASQFIQAEAIKTAVEHFRSRKYKTAGALFWQLNDAWPVFSWSAIDYLKHPKALYYYSKRFFAPCTIAFSGNTVYVINDLHQEVMELELHILRCHEKGECEPIFHTNLDRIPADVSIPYFEYNDKDRRFDVLIATLTGSCNATTYRLLRKPREMTLRIPEISLESEEDRLLLSSSSLALGVKIEGCTEPEDNFFVLWPDKRKEIRVNECSHTRIRTINEIILKAKGEL